MRELRQRAGQTTDEVKGAGHGFTAAGTVVHFLARWRVFTLPVVGILAVLGLYGATQVDTAFRAQRFLLGSHGFHPGSRAYRNALRRSHWWFPLTSISKVI